MLLQRPFYLLQEGDEQEAHALENSSQAVPSLKDQQRRRAGRIAPREGVSDWACNSLFKEILWFARDGINVRETNLDRIVCKLCYDFSNMESFLDQQMLKLLLVSTAYEAFSTDTMRNLEIGIPVLLEDGMKVLIYAEEYDVICNWLENLKWVKEMVWSCQKSFLAAPVVPFKVDGAEAGLKQSYGPLSFVKVHNTGYLVPIDQPIAAQEMLQRWMQGTL
ncbi:hypothetical protein M9H77_16252 [Catharanthus roseus]|uniref:Uncharacterized protein n=1 Tax=Catharanthus roseus TaxID=4058 RepID=A0ACC0AZS3_CATRO|nr:hypothetical protein M9H77_16252 [Catharanthus roseus]